MSEDIKLSERLVALPFRTAKRAFEREYLMQALKRNGGNVSRTADAVNLDRCALHRKIARLEVKT